jgi:phage tail sheath protein FI
MPAFRHGVYTKQLPTSILPPARVDSAIPVVIGTAPVHMVKAGYTGPVNEPVLAHTYAGAVEALGYSEDWASYSLCEFMFSQFGLFGVGPLVLINVFDPATHKSNVAAEAKALANDQITLDHPGLVADPTVQDDTDTTAYVLDTDYSVDRITGVITRIATGSIGATDTLHVTYDYGDPSLVDADDIIGGIDSGTGARSGMELIEEVFPRFQLVPGLICAPGWSQNPLVAAVMGTKAASINGLFRAMAVVDIDCSGTGVEKYTDATNWKTTNNYTDENMIVCWPKLKLEGKQFWMSTQAAGLMGKVDQLNGSIPYESPSNKALEMNGLILADGTEVIMGHSEGHLPQQPGHHHRAELDRGLASVG